MSWSVSVGKVPAADVPAAIDALELGAHYGADFAYPEAQEQLDAAKVAAKTLFANAALGETDRGEYNILLGGHAEPHHERRPGFAGDFVTVTVQRYYDYLKD